MGGGGVRGLLKMDEVARTLGVETCVMLTTLLLVVSFLVDFLSPWLRATSFMLFVVPAVEALSYTMVHYTVGLMHLSAAEVNDYFKVWAVLLVTLQYSVRTGRSKIPMLDLMSSFWTANILRLDTFLDMKVALFLVWSLNAARIVSYFASSDKAKALNQESLRLTADYMSYEHELGGSQSQSQISMSSDAAAAAADPPGHHGMGFRMHSYKYLVLGENQNQNQIRLVDPAAVCNKNNLITLDKIWGADGGESGLLGATADQSNRLKDVSLSFALYKLLRRRFYDLPLHEARSPTQGNKKIRSLVFDYILQDAERAFRVTATQLSFLQDFFYSKHADYFADGRFPLKNLVLSLLLVAATGYITYPLRHISDNKAAGHKRVTQHGALITRVILSLIVAKELAEIYMYVFSLWTTVLMLCSYAKHRCLRGGQVERAMRTMLFFMTRSGRGRWDDKIHQKNLLVFSRGVKLGTFSCMPLPRGSASIKLEACTKQAILESIKRLEKTPVALSSSYFSNAFGAPNQHLHKQLQWAVELEADTHRILVWHIATCLCEINLAAENGAPMLLKLWWLPQKPFVKKPKAGMMNEPAADGGSHPLTRAAEDKPEAAVAAVWWENYMTAASLSNYCVYLVSQALVPDNAIVTNRVNLEVHKEIKHIILDNGVGLPFFRLISMQDVFTCLMGTVHMHEERAKPGDDEEAAMAAPQPPQAKKKPCTSDQLRDPLDISNSLTRKGALLGKQLMELYGEDRAGLWEKLAAFWTGFLLHLAASTTAGKYRTHLLTASHELTAHLWTLLSHAGFLGRTRHGQMILDPKELQDFYSAQDRTEDF